LPDSSSTHQITSSSTEWAKQHCWSWQVAAVGQHLMQDALAGQGKIGINIATFTHSGLVGITSIGNTDWPQL